MSNRQNLQRLYVHESVESVIPPDPFVDSFSDLELPVQLVGDGESYDENDAVVSYVPRPEYLEAAWVHCARAGYEEFDTEAYRQSGVPLTNSTGIHGETVGELAIGYMLSIARLLHIYRDRQNERTWYTPSYDRPFTIGGEQLCVIGLGTIGSGIARRAADLGMEVIGVRRSERQVPGVSKRYSPDELHEALSNARFVAIALPHTSETNGLISRDEFETMRNDAFLINVARGPIVDEEALVTALETDEIAGAALDVFETEPLPTDSPLWDLEDVIISPHKGSATNRYHLDIADLVKENIRRFRSGETLKNRVA